MHAVQVAEVHNQVSHVRTSIDGHNLEWDAELEEIWTNHNARNASLKWAKAYSKVAHGNDTS